MYIQVKLFLILCHFCPEKGLLFVQFLQTVLGGVALPIVDGLQPPHQGHQGVHQELHPPKSHSKHILQKSLLLLIFGHAILHLLTQFYQNCSCGLGVTGHFRVFSSKNCLKCQMFSQKSFGLQGTKIHQHDLVGRPHTQ